MANVPVWRDMDYILGSAESALMITSYLMATVPRVLVGPTTMPG